MRLARLLFPFFSFCWFCLAPRLLFGLLSFLFSLSLAPSLLLCSAFACHWYGLFPLVLDKPLPYPSLYARDLGPYFPTLHSFSPSARARAIVPYSYLHTVHEQDKQGQENKRKRKEKSPQKKKKKEVAANQRIVLSLRALCMLTIQPIRLHPLPFPFVAAKSRNLCCRSHIAAWISVCSRKSLAWCLVMSSRLSCRSAIS